jgi:hypothetical protein
LQRGKPVDSIAFYPQNHTTCAEIRAKTNNAPRYSSIKKKGSCPTFWDLFMVLSRISRYQDYFCLRCGLSENEVCITEIHCSGVGGVCGPARELSCRIGVNFKCSSVRGVKPS